MDHVYNTELKETFYRLVGDYTDDAETVKNLWNEIKTAYSDETRDYHTLFHLSDLLHFIGEIQGEFEDWDTVLFCLYYHDIVYDASKSDNEEKSAELAVERMTQLGISEAKIKRCKEHILATKTHEISSDSDSNLFTDADLSILGRHWLTYKSYFKSVRKEYDIYADELYVPGRTKVLQHFLEMPNIFKTELFRRKFEKQARENIAREIEVLNTYFDKSDADAAVLQDLEDLFNVFHDGYLNGYSGNHEKLTLTISCTYLANKIDPSFEQFFLQLDDVAVLEFDTWPLKRFEDPQTLTDFKTIFDLSLGILGAHIEDDQISVTCDVFSAASDELQLSGGVLRLYCQSFSIFDQTRNPMTLDELKDISAAYWGNFGNNN